MGGREKKVVGIDPGKSGGFCFIDANKKIEPYPYKSLEINMKKWKEVGVAYLELVHAFPRQGVSSTFTFGKNYGEWIGMLRVLDIPIVYVSPMVWQRYLGCLTKGNKNVTKNKAISLYPDIKITHAIADAILISLYGIQLECYV